ncbi:MAG TPA: ribulose-phosphate 3-epimerase [Deltaproteobacteria bacterium]|nr:ribulose-phosphate 3-epimerase [Deltaproteobacteria bacterium]
MTKLIAPSILSADFSRLGEEVRAVEAAGADLIHFDVMDGHFVPNITVGPLVLEAVRKTTALPIDAHLMIDHPDQYVADFVKAGANYVSVHVEASRHLHRSIQLIRSLGVKAGVALNPHTPVQSMGYVLDEVDFVLVMTVNPGFGGQKFIPGAFKKVSELDQIRREHGLSFQIEIDGGIKVENIAEVSQAGVDIFVAGSAVFHSPDYGETIRRMKQFSSCG